MSGLKGQETFRYAVELADLIDKRQEELGERYVINSDTMENFGKAYDFLSQLVYDNGGEIICLETHPEPSYAKVSAEVSIIDLYGSDIKDFIDILRNIDIFDVTSVTPESLLVSMTVNNVWEAVE